MIPKTNDGLAADFVVIRQPSRTYRMDMPLEQIAGMTDGQAAVVQAVYKILNTERYQHLIYSWDYGVELADLIGTQPDFAYPEIKRRITEALLQDDRITGVTKFDFTARKGAVEVTFVVESTQGVVDAGKVVAI